MDFTGQFHHQHHHHLHEFAAGAQPYQSFLPIHPLTPSNAHAAAPSAVSRDFNAAASPPHAFDAISAAEQFQGFEFPPAFADAAQHPQTSSFPDSPTISGTAPTAFGHHHHHHQPPPTNGSANGGHVLGVEEISLAQRGSDEDDSLTPAQSRRKAQNRAAQRAFRERKEKHVKDLEAKLASLEAAQQQASVENERLKRDLQKMSTENEILRATSVIGGGPNNSHSPEPAATDPLQYNNPTDFYSSVLQHHQNKVPSHRVVTSDDGERLLAAGATWDFIISHDLYKRGLVDVGNVSERLKDAARCDGQGPVFAESDIIDAIEQSVASGSDDLLS